MNNSIKRFLLIYITLAILGVYILISFASYWVSKEELDELYDANLEQVAKVVAAQHFATHDLTLIYNNNQSENSVKLQGEEEFYIRVLAKNNQVLYVSHPLEDVPLKMSLGLSTQKSKSKQWRVFTIKAKEDTIQVAQSLKSRKLVIKETAYSLLASQFLFIPILVLLIFLAIRKALLPLTALTSEIQSRDNTNLSPFRLEHLPAEIKPLVTSLNLFMDKVSTMVSVLKRFTADAAHELRTPITALNLQLTIIEQANSADERDLAIQNMKAGIKRSEQLVSQLLTLARIEPNSQKRVIEQFSLNELVKLNIEDLLPLAQDKLINLGLDATANLEISGVKHEINILIKNILDNAVRYTPIDGHVNILLSDDESFICLEVRDTGPGISNQDFERIFERFYRGENKDKIGSGLGLSIVKEIAIQHHAEIEVLNINPGSSFRVKFKSLMRM